jgi:serine/threonine protein kinase
LFDQILDKEKFSEKEARDIIAPIFDALIYCHSLNVVHRDVKPENLLFSSKDCSTAIIKVSDFGLARFIDAETLATTTCGTPGYVAPEVLEQQPYKQACDFWSLGVVLFILLSGQPPFYDEDNFELFEKIKKCEYDFKAPAWKTISNEAKDFISKLLVADPEQRLTGQAIMEHPWILGQTSVDQEKDSGVLEKMRDWNSKRKL